MHTSYFYICENLHLSISEKNNNPTKCHFVINSKMHVNCPYVVLDIFNVFNGEIFFEKETHLLKNKKSHSVMVEINPTQGEIVTRVAHIPRVRDHIIKMYLFLES